MPPIGLPFHHRYSHLRRRFSRGLLNRAGFCLLVAVSLLTTAAILNLHKSIAPAFASQHQAPWASSPDVSRTTRPISSDAMESSRSDLSSFVHRMKEFALARLGSQEDPSSPPPSSPLVLIMGNSAGDADSLTSAISLAYFLNKFPHTSLPLSSPLPANAVYVPLIQTNRSDSHLRPENVAMLAAAGVAQEDVLYLSDLTDPVASKGLGLDLARSEKLSPSKGTLLGLVDHPQLELPWQDGDSDSHVSNGGVQADQRKVVILVDHHADVGKHQDASLRVFRQPEGSAEPNPIGSAQSIIVDLFTEFIARNAASVPRNLSNMAISTVLIDTDNMRPSPRGRASQTDFAAIETLLPISSFSSAFPAQQFEKVLLEHAPYEVQQSMQGSTALNFDAQVFEASSPASLSDKTASIAQILAASKAAVQQFSGLDLLRRDYKTAVVSVQSLGNNANKILGPDRHDLRAGFSSVNLGLAAWLHRGQGHGTESESESVRAWQAYWRTLREWMAEQKLDVAVVGTSFHKDKQDGGKHCRELLLALSSRSTVAEAEAQRFFSRLRDELEPDATLELTAPWKGARLTTTGKKERVAGLAHPSGRLQEEIGTRKGSVAPIWAAVWRQDNARANRKVYLPTIVSALQKTAKML